MQTQDTNLVIKRSSKSNTLYNVVEVDQEFNTVSVLWRDLSIEQAETLVLSNEDND